MNCVMRWVARKVIFEARVRDLIKSLGDPSLQGEHCDVEAALRDTFVRIRKRIRILEAAAIYKNMSAERANAVMQAMNDKDWTFVHDGDQPKIRGLGDQQFTADQLEALHLELRAFDKEYITELDADRHKSSQ